MTCALIAVPCKGCTRRALPPEPDCHNEERCPAWAAFQENKRKIEAARRRESIPDIALAAERIRRKDRFIKSDDR